MAKTEMAKQKLQLGRAVSLPGSPEEAKLDAVPNPHKDSDYLVRFLQSRLSTNRLPERKFEQFAFEAG